MQIQTSPYLSPSILTFISKKITQKKLLKPVLQIPKSLLPISFALVSKLRPLCPPQTQLYILYDSMKKQCCTDIIGAEHVDYDGIFHFGYACFSQLCDYSKCWYVLPHCQQSEEFVHGIVQKQVIADLKIKEIKLVICDQSIYQSVIKFKQLFQQFGMQIARLPFDRRKNDKYFGFGYYCSQQTLQKGINIMVIAPDQTQSPCSIIQNLYLSSSSMKICQIHYTTPTSVIQVYQPTTNKRLMQRLSQISELQKYSTFGILVSNASTNFCQQQIRRCRAILNKQGLKHFTFMMNNLNQCKLGNFPEIQVYVVISCYNWSLYTIKDFYRVVVTPYDLEVAFCQASFQNYTFDFNQPQSQLQPQQTKLMQQPTQPQTSTNQDRLTKLNNELVVQNIIQTLDFYRQRQYKGLTFAEKKEVEKIKLGKIGIAAQYKPLTEEKAQNEK